MKTCSKCKEKKPRKEFYKDKSKKDGLASICKDCACIYRKSNARKKTQARYGKSEKGTKAHARYNKSSKRKTASARYYRSKGKETMTKYGKTEKGKVVRRKAKADWAKRNPEKVNAKSKIHGLVRQGKMPRPSTLTCRCGAPAAEYHHPDYSKPLEVISLCVSCHKTVHRGQ